MMRTSIVGLMRPLTSSVTLNLWLRLRSSMSASGAMYCKRDANSDPCLTGKGLFNPGTVRVAMGQKGQVMKRRGRVMNVTGPPHHWLEASISGVQACSVEATLAAHAAAHGA